MAAARSPLSAWAFGRGEIAVSLVGDAAALKYRGEVVAIGQAPGCLAAGGDEAVSNALAKPDGGVVVGDGRGEIAFVVVGHAAVPQHAGEVVTVGEAPGRLAAGGDEAVADALAKPDGGVVVGDGRGEIAAVPMGDTAVRKPTGKPIAPLYVRARRLSARLATAGDGRRCPGGEQRQDRQVQIGAGVVFEGVGLGGQQAHRRSAQPAPAGGDGVRARGCGQPIQQRRQRLEQRPVRLAARALGRLRGRTIRRGLAAGGDGLDRIQRGAGQQGRRAPDQGGEVFVVGQRRPEVLEPNAKAARAAAAAVHGEHALELLQGQQQCGVVRLRGRG